jgi:hypothetical protein
MKLQNLLGYEPPDFVAHPAMISCDAVTFKFTVFATFLHPKVSLFDRNKITYFLLNTQTPCPPRGAFARITNLIKNQV